VKPLYLEGVPDRAAIGFRQQMRLPLLGSLAGPQPASVDAVLASYDHSNTINLFAVGALVAWLRGSVATEATPEKGPRLAAPDAALPMLASEGDVSPETWQRVLRLNRFGDTERPLILASMYRHLAHAPAFLERLEAVLEPVQADGTLDQAIVVNRRNASGQARVLARAISTEPPQRAGEIAASVSAFVDHAIGKMVTICRAVRMARN
jgi:hypothetical protein